MKTVIASDLHGDARAAAKIFELADREGAGQVVLLGDLLYHGPRNPLPEGWGPKETAALLNENAHRILAVRGNCDAEVDQMMLSFPIMSEYALLCMDGRRFFATHGHRVGFDAPPPLQAGDVLLQGHTHIARLERVGQQVYANPGSVSLPKGGGCPSLLLWDGQSLTLCTTEGERLQSLTL